MRSERRVLGEGLPRRGPISSVLLLGGTSSLDTNVSTLPAQSTPCSEPCKSQWWRATMQEMAASGKKGLSKLGYRAGGLSARYSGGVYRGQEGGQECCTCPVSDSR